MIQATKIRSVRPGDARGIAKVYVETWRSSYAGILPDRVLLGMSVADQSVAWARAVSHTSETILVADEPGTGIVGLGSCGPNRKQGTDFMGEVYTLYVALDYQERGLGRELLDGLFKCMLADGRRSAIIWVLANNPSRFFYEAMGGRRVAEREERLWGETLREVAYGWPDLKGVFATLG